MAKRKTRRKADAALRSIKKEEGRIFREEKKLEKMEKRIIKEEKNIEDLEHRLLEEEHEVLASLGKMRLKREHVLDFFKIIGGSLVGTSFGSQFLDKASLAATMPWINVLTILIVSLIIGGALIYKAEKETILKKKSPAAYVGLRLAYIWVLSIAIGGLSVFLFLQNPIEPLLLFKAILIGSYPALAGAIGFNFI